MSRENRFLKRGADFIYGKKRKMVSSALDQKTKIESREKKRKNRKVEIGRELKINRLNCYSIKETDYSHRFS